MPTCRDIANTPIVGLSARPTLTNLVRSRNVTQRGKLMIKRKILTTAVVSAALLLGGGVAAANAATVSTSMSQWFAGDVGSWRTSTGAQQYIAIGSTCSAGPAGATKPTSVQMQLQRSNGAIPVSEGNISQACGTTFNWGTKTTGAQYRYQLNGYTQDGVWRTGPFSAPSVTISY